MNYAREENKITISEDDCTFNALRTDPYGFWVIKGTKGKQRIKFDSEYTSADDAVRAIKRKLIELNV